VWCKLKRATTAMQNWEEARRDTVTDESPFEHTDP